jgi:hypothetical protein
MSPNLKTGSPPPRTDRHVPRTRRFQLFAALVVAVAVAMVGAALLAAENDDGPPGPVPASTRGPA